MGRNCVVCYGWTTSAALSQQETDDVFRSLLHAGTHGLCVSGRDVCVYRPGVWVCGVCAVLGLFVFFCLFSYLILCMNPSGSGSICVFVRWLLYVVGRAGSWDRIMGSSSARSQYFLPDCLCWDCVLSVPVVLKDKANLPHQHHDHSLISFLVYKFSI